MQSLPQISVVLSPFRYSLDEMTFFTNFHCGLRDKIAKQLAITHITTLDEAIHIAEHIENDLQRQPSLGRTTSSTAPPAIGTSSTMKKCFSSQGLGHKAN